MQRDTEEKDKKKMRRKRNNNRTIHQYSNIITCLKRLLSSGFFQLICITSLICNLKQKAQSTISRQSKLTFSWHYGFSWRCEYI